jgi:hypothetical protein
MAAEAAVCQPTDIPLRQHMKKSDPSPKAALKSAFKGKSSLPEAKTVHFQALKGV